MNKNNGNGVNIQIGDSINIEISTRVFYAGLFVLGMLFIWFYFIHKSEDELKCQSICKAKGTDKYSWVRGYDPLLDNKWKATRQEECICLTDSYLNKKNIEHENRRRAFSCRVSLDKKYSNGDWPSGEYKRCLEKVKL